MKHGGAGFTGHTEPARLPQQRDDLPSGLHLAGPLCIFQQDSDSRLCEGCLRRVMPQMTWPPHSTDLNPLQVVYE